tara:strand:- start:345 stop:560 length:216 start_codon:yes stop_codon:yes gene_type:complete
MPIISNIKGGGRPGQSSRKGNVRQRRRSVALTTANILAYPGNFRIDDLSVNWAELTTNGFTGSKQTLWAKE